MNKLDMPLSARSLVKIKRKRDKVEGAAPQQKGDEMRRFKLYNALPLSLIMVIGCSTPEFEAEQARKAQQVQEQEQAALPHGPPGKVLKAAMERLDLRPEQRRELDALHAEVLEKTAGVLAQHTGLVTNLSNVIRGGSLDVERLRASIGSFASSVHGLKPVFINAMNRGHKVLDTDQRAKLAQILKEHHEKRAKGCEGHKHFKRLGAKIGITDQQREQFKQLVMANMTAEERAQMEQRKRTWRERHAAALEAFKRDDFDAAKLPAFNRPPRDRLKAERVVRVLNLALPMLRPEQRVQLAKSIELRSASVIAELKKAHHPAQR
jgi:hypothetical protein